MQIRAEFFKPPHRNRRAHNDMVGRYVCKGNAWSLAGMKNIALFSSFCAFIITMTMKVIWFLSCQYLEFPEKLSCLCVMHMRLPSLARNSFLCISLWSYAEFKGIGRTLLN